MNEEMLEFLENICLTYNDELFKTAKKRMNNHIEDAEDVVGELWKVSTILVEDLYKHPNKIAWLYNWLDICVKRFNSTKFYRISKKDTNGKVIVTYKEKKTVPIYEKDENRFTYEVTFYGDELSADELFDEYKEFLSEKHRRYLKYKFQYGLKTEEIAKIENMNYSAVTSLGNRVMKKIKNYYNVI